MNHRVGFNKLGLKSSHRKALHRNMATSLFRYERITTTKAKALAVRRTVEKMITRAKVDSVHNRRIVGRDIKDKEILAKLFTEIGPRYANRPGGYTRVLKLGWRKGDAAETVILELVEEEIKSAGKKKSSKKKATKKASEAKTEAVKEEVKEEESKAEEKPAEEEKAAVEEAPVKEEAEKAAADDTPEADVKEDAEEADKE